MWESGLSNLGVMELCIFFSHDGGRQFMYIDSDTVLKFFIVVYGNYGNRDSTSISYIRYTSARP